MTTATLFATGTFCWTELHSKDPAGSRAFYTSLFGWNATDVPISETDIYTMLDVAGIPVAALTPMQHDQVRANVPTHWMSYIAVDNVDAYAAKVSSLGGTVLAEPFDVMEAGRMTVIQEPTGATFALWQAGSHPGSGLRDSEAGSLCWHDMYTDNVEKAKSFMASLLGYGVRKIPIPDVDLWMMTPKGLDPEGDTEFVIIDAMDGRPSCFQPFFSVVDANATLAKAVELGAEVLCPVMDAGGGNFAHFRDPQGGHFAIFEWANKG